MNTTVNKNLEWENDFNNFVILLQTSYQVIFIFKNVSGYNKSNTMHLFTKDLGEHYTVIYTYYKF